MVTVLLAMPSWVYYTYLGGIGFEVGRCRISQGQIQIGNPG